MISVYMQKRCLLVFDEFCSCLKAQRAELGLNQRQSLSSCPQEHTRKTFSETKQPKAKRDVFPTECKPTQCKTALFATHFKVPLQIIKQPDTPIYYAHPYSAYERGTNEKQNSLVRRFSQRGRV